jgi:hypothetical protein
MKVIIACEKSQEVAKAFREEGHEAFSCDLEPCTGGHPEWHIQDDAMNVLRHDIISPFTTEWDIVIAHPPCDFLTVANTYINRGCSKYTAQEAQELRKKAILFFEFFTHLKNRFVAIENPIGIMSKIYRKPDQIIQPWYFGHPESKATCLWLKNLPLLQPTNYADFKQYRCRCGNVFELELGKYGCCDWPAKPLWDNQTKSGQNNLPPSKNRAELRAKTYPGIAKAMANQWSKVQSQVLARQNY